MWQLLLETMIQIKKAQKVEIAVPSKYLIYFWRTFDIPLIYCEVYLALSWSATYWSEIISLIGV